ncbi:UvrD-helicase domain-containing protein [Silvimonas soli]|uniref:UvrD-helicase domain-containing protein n=1 Tax=Silvimonas soli TaxID=2980100 RepID=UPI0024B395BB|nr:UvrD-helicase domain-containing protein [Silvimonas soli]
MSDIPELSPAQQQIVSAITAMGRHTWQQHLLIEAGAGTGKTTTVVAARQALVDSGVGVLAVTFSSAGRLRFAQVHQAHFGAEVPYKSVFTFDGLAFEVLCGAEDGRSFSGDGFFTQDEIRQNAVNDSDQLVEMLGELVDELNDVWEGQIPSREMDLIALLELISNTRIANVFRDPRVYPDEDFLEEFQEREREDYIASLDLPPWFYALFTRFERLRRESRHLVGVDGAAYDLAGDPQALVRYVRAKGIKVVVVDEFHDTKALHFELIKVLISAGCRLVLMGDRHQDIFAWRGLRPFSAFEAASQIANMETLTLPRSWRYGQRIARIADHIVQILQPGTEKVTGARAQSAKLHATDDLVAWLAQSEQKGVPLAGHCAILPTAADCMALQMRLLDAGVSYQLVQRVPYFFHGQEFRLIRALAVLHSHLFGAAPAFHVNNLYALDILIDVPGLQLDREVRADLRRELGLDGATRLDGKRLLTADPAIFGFALDEVGKHMPSTLTSEQAWPQWLAHAISTLHLHAFLHQRAQHPAAGRQSGLLLEEIQRRFCVDQSPAAQLQAWDTRIERFMKRRAASSLSLTSVLHAKGHEYERVLLPVNAFGWQRHLQQPTAAGWRELYVAVTRAQAGIMLELAGGDERLGELAKAVFGG